MNTKLSALLLATVGLTSQISSYACTGITLKSKDGGTMKLPTNHFFSTISESIVANEFQT